jgi:hypothetical protein
MDTFDDVTLDLFAQLDFDIISALKAWQRQGDFILSSLSKMIINRDLLKNKSDKVAIEDLQPLKERFALENNISLLRLTTLFSKEK